MAVVECPKTSLPRALDVNVSISRPLTEIATDMTMICFATPSVDFAPDANRIQYFSSLDAVADACGVSTPAYYAAAAFFARSDRPTTMAVGRVVAQPIEGKLTTGKISIADLNTIQNGSFKISIADDEYEIENCDFTGLTTVTQIADAVNHGLSVNGAPASALATDDGCVAITTDAKGDGAEISFMEAGEEHDAQPAYLVTGDVNIETLKTVEYGNLYVTATVGRESHTFHVTGIDLSSIQTLAEAVQILQVQSDLSGMHLVVEVLDETKIKARTSVVGNVEISYLIPGDVSAGEPSELVSGQVTVANLTSVTDGEFAISQGGVNYNVSGLDFSSAEDIDGVASIIDTAVASVEGLDIEVTSITNESKLAFTATENGLKYGLQYLSAVTGGTGTDVSSLLMGTEATATSLDPGVDPQQDAANVLMGTESSASEKVNGTAPTINVASLIKGTRESASSLYAGYTPGDLASELTLISKAAKCNGKAVFGWVLDARYRDTDSAKVAADWAEGQEPAYLSLCSNDVNCYNPSNSNNIAYYCHDRGYKKTSVIYHHAPSQYPEMSYIALALSVNYALQDSTLTMKFKQLDGISTSPLTETQVAALDANNCNCYVLMGNNSSVVREGKQSADTWFTDSHVNLSNYKEELQVEVYNVFLRNKKLPYTTAGQNKLVSAAAKINSRYTRNGTFADREVENPELESGVEVLPATSIQPASVASATASERASRLAPPIAITAYEAGAFHKVDIDVNVYN